MTLFRIAKRAYIDDLSGEGARLYGGRWNPKGLGVVYSAENRALATVEFLVHVPVFLVPNDIRMAEIVVPDDSLIETVDPKGLPENWRESPPPLDLADVGRAWVNRGTSLLLRVPSAVVAGEWNVLINPQHERARAVVVRSVQPVSFDERLLRVRPGSA
jgi:RES domain-containing protein